MQFVHGLRSYRQHRRFQQSSIILGVLIGLLFLFGCGDNTISTAPTPVGATSGLNTFIFFYTDT